MNHITRTPWLDQIYSYQLHYPDETQQMKPLLELIRDDVDLFNRKTLPGHITASGIVIKNGKILLIFHPFLGKWLQPGGHVESGETPLEAAMREVLEETGVPTQLHPWHHKYHIPFDIHIHSIPANPKKQEPSHFHYDLRYLLRIDTTKEIVPAIEQDHESSWKNIEECHLKKVTEKLLKSNPT